MKGDEKHREANNIFSESGIKITATGERHLGAVIGSKEFRELYVKDKIDSWIADVE